MARRHATGPHPDWLRSDGCVKRIEAECCKSTGTGPAVQLLRGRRTHDACRLRLSHDLPTLVRAWCRWSDADHHCPRCGARSPDRADICKRVRPGDGRPAFAAPWQLCRRRDPHLIWRAHRQDQPAAARHPRALRGHLLLVQ